MVGVGNRMQVSRLWWGWDKGGVGMAVGLSLVLGRGLGSLPGALCESMCHST